MSCSRINLTIIDKNNNKTYYYGPSTRWRRFYSTIASAVAQKYIIRVSYGRHIDNFGKKTLFFNKAICDNKKDAKEVLSAFLEIKPDELD